MMEYGVNIFCEEDIIDQLAKNSNKVVMRIQSVGPNQLKNIDEIEEVWDFYYGKCDINVLNALRQFGELYCYFTTIEQAVNAMEEWFPFKNQLLDEEMHYFISCYLVSPDGTVRLQNY